MTNRDQVARIAAQIGSSLMPDNAVWTNRFTVKSTSSSRVYVVAQRRTDGVWGCGCQGWTHYRHCKHTRDILRRLASLTDTRRIIPATDEPYDPAVVQMLMSARTAYLDLEVQPVQGVVKRRGRVLDLD